jgi:AcrR family transcriptional regulator
LPVTQTDGRPAQRRRTRKAIVEAAKQLLASGRTPSIDQIARAADVSRRTVYLHFPTLDQLLLDATVGALSDAGIEAALDRSVTGDDPVARVEALAGAILDLAPGTLALGRQLVRLTADNREPRPDGAPRRGYRRIEWIERAIEPLRDRLSDEQHDRLVSALAMVIGWEALIVLGDVRGLDQDEQRAAMVWAARTLVEAMLAESAAARAD